MDSIYADVLIFNAKELLTLNYGYTNGETEVEKRLGVIRDGAVAIKDGYIAATGKTDELMKRVKVHKNTVKIDASNKVVVPGFVDPHTHLAFMGTREREFLMRQQGIPQAKILKEENTGIISTVRWTRKASFEELLNETRKHLEMLVDWGTTTVEIKSGYGLNLEEEIKTLKIARTLGENTAVNIKATLLAAHIVPPEYHMRDEKYVELVIDDVIPIIAKNKLADFNDVYCEKGAFTREQAKKILKRGLEYGLKPKIHADELSDSGGAEVAATIHCVSADHLMHTPESEFRKLREAGVVAVLLPVTTFLLGEEKYADARKMIDAGVTVALGTDFNPGTSFCPSMPIVMTLATVKLKMRIDEVIMGATLNAAKAIDMEREVGSIEAGKRGNVNVLRISHFEEIPYRFGENYVETVISNGEVLKGGE